MILSIFILCMLVFGVFFIILSIMGLFALLFNTVIPLGIWTVIKVFSFGVALFVGGLITITAIASKEYCDSKKAIK